MAENTEFIDLQVELNVISDVLQKIITDNALQDARFDRIEAQLGSLQMNSAFTGGSYSPSTPAPIAIPAKSSVNNDRHIVPPMDSQSRQELFRIMINLLQEEIDASELSTVALPAADGLLSSTTQIEEPDNIDDDPAVHGKSPPLIDASDSMNVVLTPVDVLFPSTEQMTEISEQKLMVQAANPMDVFIDEVIVATVSFSSSNYQGKNFPSTASINSRFVMDEDFVGRDVTVEKFEVRHGTPSKREIQRPLPQPPDWSCRIVVADKHHCEFTSRRRCLSHGRLNNPMPSPPPKPPDRSGQQKHVELWWKGSLRWSFSHALNNSMSPPPPLPKPPDRRFQQKKVEFEVLWDPTMPLPPPEPPDANHGMVDTVVFPPFVAIAVHPRQGVWEIIRVNVFDLNVELLSVFAYFGFTEELVEGEINDNFVWELYFAAFSASFLCLKRSSSIDNGVQFLNRHLSSGMFSNRDSGAHLLKFFYAHTYKGYALMLNDRIQHIPNFQSVVIKAKDHHSHKLAHDTPYSEFEFIGMGSDLFNSYAEPSCVALIVSLLFPFEVNHDFTAMLYPLLVNSRGILLCLITTLFANSIFVSFSFTELYDFTVSTIGMLSTTAKGLAVDAYGPINDNAGGIDEMEGMSLQVREGTDAFVTTLRKAEQLLWAGSNWVNIFNEAHKWAEGIRNCVTQIELWLCHRDSSVKKVHLEYVDELLRFSPIPCNEPHFHKLKDYAAEARLVIQEVNPALSSFSNMPGLEFLYSKVFLIEMKLKSSNVITTLINVVLDISKVVEGRIELPRENINLHGILEVVISLIKHIAPALQQLIIERDSVLALLKVNLLKAQTFMKKYANKKRKFLAFHIGDMVLVKLQPYRQHSVALHKNHKLGLRYVGLLPVSEKIGEVAYKLLLSPSAKIHLVFHISLLKPCKGNHDTPYVPLPLLTNAQGPMLNPQPILQTRNLVRNDKQVFQFLVQWEGLSLEATWEDCPNLAAAYPNLNLEDKVDFNGGSNVMNRNEQLGNNADLAEPSNTNELAHAHGKGQLAIDPNIQQVRRSMREKTVSKKVWIGFYYIREGRTNQLVCKNLEDSFSLPAAAFPLSQSLIFCFLTFHYWLY